MNENFKDLVRLSNNMNMDLQMASQAQSHQRIATYESIALEPAQTERSASAYKQRVYPTNKMGGPQKAYIMKSENKFVRQK